MAVPGKMIGMTNAGEKAQVAMNETGRGLFDGYEAYQTPTDADFRKVLINGIVVVDTNVLLNLYRYNLQARDDYLAVLMKLKPNLWIPAQVVQEFWKNREAILMDPRKTSETVRLLGEQRGKALVQIRQWAKLVSLSRAGLADLTRVLDDAFEAVTASVEEHEKNEFEVFVKDTNQDTILARLARILHHQVGPEFDEDELARLTMEGTRRIEAEIPPGFADVRKKGVDGALGDFFVWEQILRQAESRRLDILFVTADSKPDWWRTSRGELRGPRRELVRELRDRAGTMLYMLTPDRLLEHAKAALKVAVSDESAAFVAQVGDSLAAQDDLSAGGWDESGMATLLGRLATEAPVQRLAVTHAARHSGFVSRDAVYALGNYDPTRKLVGFTRPVKRIAQELRDHGAVAEEAIEVFETTYDGADQYGWATGFSVPKTLIPLILSQEG
ncbi:PIN-like domain-containing protein [Fodinicola acaciae]|uniref:PIN-like domain-containing protein n=1 Tax=Fodinicola acaciae TaxID=2681555 RepID=UPI0013D415D7|nr:PIN-like domain-containing protein [Fodinicola acaciae]